MNAKDIIKLADDWSNGDPELCAEIAVNLGRLYQAAYADGFQAGLAGRAPAPQAEQGGDGPGSA